MDQSPEFVGPECILRTTDCGLADSDSWTHTGNNFMAAMLCSLIMHVQQLSNEPRTTGVVEEL